MEIKQKNTRKMEEKNKQWYEAHTWLLRTVS